MNTTKTNRNTWEYIQDNYVPVDTFVREAVAGEIRAYLYQSKSGKTFKCLMQTTPHLGPKRGEVIQHTPTNVYPNNVTDAILAVRKLIKSRADINQEIAELNGSSFLTR